MLHSLLAAPQAPQKYFVSRDIPVRARASPGTGRSQRDTGELKTVNFRHTGLHRYDHFLLSTNQRPCLAAVSQSAIVFAGIDQSEGLLDRQKRGRIDQVCYNDRQL